MGAVGGALGRVAGAVGQAAIQRSPFMSAAAAFTGAKPFGSPVASPLAGSVSGIGLEGPQNLFSPPKAATQGSGSKYRDAIASIESAGSGDYAAIGPTHKTLGRALGRYQVMEANIPQWSKEALGRAVTADEFMRNPKLQDAIFDHQFGKYVKKYGEEGAAQAWFGGEGGVGKTGRKDSLGTSIGGYGQKFTKALGNTQPQFQDAAVASAGTGVEASASAFKPQAQPGFLSDFFAKIAPEANPATMPSTGANAVTQPTALDRVLEAALGGGSGGSMGVTQDTMSETTPAVDLGAEEVAGVAAGLMQKVKTPDVRAQDRKTKIRQRISYASS